MNMNQSHDMAVYSHKCALRLYRQIPGNSVQTPPILNFNKLDKIFYISGLSLFSIWQESVVVRYHCIDCYDLRKVYFDLLRMRLIRSFLNL